MTLTIEKKKADAFANAMEKLSKKFNDKYLTGNLEDYVRLGIVDNKMALKFIKPVPEMVQIACTMAFVDTLL